MANLETLELQINGSAEQAKGGIDKLIHSLSDLSDALTKPFSDLVAFRKELDAIASIKLPSMPGSFGAGMQQQAKSMAVAAKAVKASTTAINNARLPAGDGWQQVTDPKALVNLSKGLANHLINNANPAELLAMKIRSKTDSLVNGMASGKISDEQLANRVAQIRKLQTEYDKLVSKEKEEANVAKAFSKLQTEYDKLASKEKEGTNLATEFAEKAEHGWRRFGQSITKTFSQIGRIAKTMLIRTALRAMMKAFSESWQAAYAFSKAAGGEFAKSIDTMKGALSGATTNIVTAFAPAISALVPIINVLAGAIQFLCNAISWLFSLLGMTGEFFGASTDAINAYSKSAKGGGGATKEMLASFDELNVISSTGGGGGGGGGSPMSGVLSGIVSDEMAMLQMIVGESLLAIGLILACTGHIGIGTALMAVGAAAIAKTIIQDWDGLSSQVKGEIAKIMTIIGVSTLALGAILAFSGASIPLGIGLMVIGAANLAAAAYVNFKGGITDEVRGTLTTITGIVGGALLAIGAILAFSGANIPLGIGLMIAGGLSLASAIALNWNSLSGTVIGVFNTVKTALVTAWNAVTEAVSKAWDAVKQWWEDSGLGQAVRDAWENTKMFFVNMWRNIKERAAEAWNNIKIWWETSEVGEKVRGAWEDTKMFFVNMWRNIKERATETWNNVKGWWTTNVTSKIEAEGIWGGVKGFFEGVWNGISELASSAWGVVSEWWSSTIQPSLSGVWAGISDWFNTTVWKPLCNFIKPAWNAVSEWWGSTIQPSLSGIWSGIASWFDSTVWTPLSDAIAPAWNAAVKWWQNGILPSIKAAWAGVQAFFTDMWEAITAPLRTLWDFISKIFGVDSKTAEYTLTVVTNQVTNQVTQKSSTVKTDTDKTVNTPTVSGIVSNLTNPTQAAASGIKTAIDWVSNLFKAEGAYGIPAGDLFIANEAGAELIGSINGRTSVANQDQIIEGISNGVERANAEQNNLLRQQNELLRGILAKEMKVDIGSSAQFGRTVKQSLDAYNGLAGGY